MAKESALELLAFRCDCVRELAIVDWRRTVILIEPCSMLNEREGSARKNGLRQRLMNAATYM